MIYNIDYIQRVYDRIYRMEYNIYVHSCAVVGVYVYATHYVTRWHIRNSESVAWLNMWATDTFEIWRWVQGPDVVGAIMTRHPLGGGRTLISKSVRTCRANLPTLARVIQPGPAWESK